MTGLSDHIEQFIMAMLDEEDQAELQRNKLASQFHCAPSQINYVLSTRFTNAKGYIIESRRGGGGYIRIVRIREDAHDLLQYALEKIGDERRLSEQDARGLITRLCQSGAVDQKTANMMYAAISERALLPAERGGRDVLRASVMMEMLKMGLRQGGTIK